MAYIQPEIVARAKQMDLFTYLKNYEPYELVKVSGNVYCTKTHDSLRISNGMWMWWSRGIGGRSALDYLIKVRGETFTNAVQMITGQAAIQPPVFVSNDEKKPKILEPPERNVNMNKAMNYLSQRGISKEIIQYCIEAGMIYESADYNNVIFVGRDENNKMRYAAYRSCNSKRIMGDVVGSDKRFSFRFESKQSEELHAFESAIDLLSYATWKGMSIDDLKNANLVSLAGIYVPKKEPTEMKTPLALESFLENSKQIRTVYLHLDNDEPGRLAAKMIEKKLEKKVKVIDDPPPKGKDFNDFLKMELEKREKEKGGKDER